MKTSLSRSSLIALVCLATVHESALGVCPSGLPNQIFCDDYDCYCSGSACSQDPPVKCAEGATKTNGPMLNVWVLTSRNLANGNPCGSTFNLEDTLQVFSEPFGNGLPCQQGAQLGHITVTIRDDIQNTFGAQYQAVVGTDANPLVISMNLQNQAGDDRFQAANVYYELSFGSDFAPADYVRRDCSLCVPPVSVTQDWDRVLCAQDATIPGCPDTDIAPLHASIAVGEVAYLDPDPCDCGQATHGSKNPHLAFFDGVLWHSLQAGAYPGSGDFLLRGGLGSLKLTLTSSTAQIEYWAYNEAVPPVTTLEYSVATVPRKYLGAFDTLHAGMGIGCELTSSGWDTCVAPRRCLRGSPSAGRPDNDDFVIYGGEGYLAPAHTGPCCQPNGTCAITTAAGCTGTYQGDYLTCGVIPCYPACTRIPYANADGDSDVDGDDFGEFQKCFNPAGVPAGCACFDRGDGFPNGKIDQTDFEAFRECVTGSSVAFVPAEHPNCPPHPGIPASMWMHEDFEAYVDQAALNVQWPIDIGLGFDLKFTGGNDGPQCVNGAKTDSRRNTHDLVQHIQAAPGGAGKDSVNGTDDAPLVLEAAYQLNSSLDVARRQDFFLDLAKGTDSTPRSVAGTGSLRDVIAIGAFTAYNDSHIGYREGLMYYNGQTWIHLTGLQHGPGWNYMTVTIRTTIVEITYYDETLSHGIQTQMLPRVYTGDFDKIAINSDDCLIRVQAADGFKLSGGVFLP